MKKKIIVITIVLLAIGAFLIFRGNDGDPDTVTAEERELLEEVFETGVVRSGDTLNLSFGIGGTLESLNVSEGQSVSRGDIVGRLKSDDLEIRRSQTLSQIDAKMAEFNILRQGARQEEIEDLERRLEEAEESLEIAEKSLSQAESGRETAMENAYTGTPSLITKAELLAKNIKDDYKDLRNRYFAGFYLSDTYVARRSIRDIEQAYDGLRIVSRDIDKASSFEEMDEGLTKAEETFDLIKKNTEILIDVSETDFYERRFSIESEALLWETKDKVSEMLSSIRGKMGEIKSVRNETDSSVTSAESNVSSARSARNEIRDRVEAAKRGGREEEIEAMEASIRGLNYELRLIEREIGKSVLHAPRSGKVSKIHQREAEEISPGSPVITLISDDEFYVEVDIYEGDIPSVNIGDPVIIELVPFPGEFAGEVVHINESGQVIDGIVSFNTEISIEDPPERLMNEMTADTTIETSRKKAISLPREAIRRDGARRYVKIWEDQKEREVDVEVGISDAYGYVEIISGLSEGDRVIID